MTSYVDVVVVGAGIVGLAHAVDAVRRGLTVAVVERDGHATGASIRNFGHGCVTAQAGAALGYAIDARATWVRLAREAGFWLRESGTVLAARHDDEMAVLEEFREERGDQVVLLPAGKVPVEAVGGALFPLDIRVDPREAVGAVARWLAGQGVTFLWETSVHTIEPGLVGTSRGPITAKAVVVCVGHDVDRHFPDLSRRFGVRRCALHMLRVANPVPHDFDPAVLTGFSMLRYDGFATLPTAPKVRARLEAESPHLVDAGLNLMFTQRPDGDLTIGDTHRYATTLDPFNAEELDRFVLDEIARLLGVARLDVRERWRGVYASADRPFLDVSPVPGVRVVSVTSGIGMTTAFGLAPRVLDELLT
uniref:TIGR03364 family FAD-dependent oxidoreductase n=1 Tax=Herbidospora sakaeratensis TaxID=564415 RepID=UPI0007842672|nr:TIGR03364 family FAD-dependent oxidoreductase [Herbidospora sakaeratensis]